MQWLSFLERNKIKINVFLFVCLSFCFLLISTVSMENWMFAPISEKLIFSHLIILLLEILNRTVLLCNSKWFLRVQILKEEILPKITAECGRKPEKGDSFILSKSWTLIWYKNLTMKNKVCTDSLEVAGGKLYYICHIARLQSKCYFCSSLT